MIVFRAGCPAVSSWLAATLILFGCTPSPRASAAGPRPHQPPTTSGSRPTIIPSWPKLRPPETRCMPCRKTFSLASSRWASETSLIWPFGTTPPLGKVGPAPGPRRISMVPPADRTIRRSTGKSPNPAQDHGDSGPQRAAADRVRAGTQCLMASARLWWRSGATGRGAGSADRRRLDPQRHDSERRPHAQSAFFQYRPPGLSSRRSR